MSIIARTHRFKIMSAEMRRHRCGRPGYPATRGTLPGSAVGQDASPPGRHQARADLVRSFAG
jgi:hypothetical protein